MKLTTKEETVALIYFDTVCEESLNDGAFTWDTLLHCDFLITQTIKTPDSGT